MTHAVVISFLTLLGLRVQESGAVADTCRIRSLETLQFAGGPYSGRPDPPGRQQWKLLVSFPDSAVLEVDFGRKHSTLRVEPARLAEIEVALQVGGFLRWPRQLGSIYVHPDPSRRDLMVTCTDGRSKTVFFYDIESAGRLAEQGASLESIQEARNFLKVWIMIRTLFVDGEAIDSREADQRFLEAEPPNNRMKLTGGEGSSHERCASAQRGLAASRVAARSLCVC